MGKCWYRSTHQAPTEKGTPTGTTLFEAVRDPNYELTIPDNSEFGNKAFTRRFAESKTGFTYNTVKEHLNQLELEGVIESLIVTAGQRHSIIRGRGRQIYYRFTNGRSPPFGVKSPFFGLPDLCTIAGDCSGPLQSQVLTTD